MNKKKFSKILENPNTLSKEQLSFIEEINQEFPFFQVSKVIYLKHLDKTDDLKFKKFLGYTAAITRNRQILYDLVNKNEKTKDNRNIIKSPSDLFVKKSLKKINEQKNFVDWLIVSDLKPIDRSNNDTASNKLISKKPLQSEKVDKQINKIESNNDMISQAGFMTETLAKLYLEQKNYDRAIQSYKILILKFPEKSSYFANQIKKIKRIKK